MLSVTSRTKALEPKDIEFCDEGLLSRILATKRHECLALRAGEHALKRQVQEQQNEQSYEKPRGFRQRLLQGLSRGEGALICESKRASPSAGEICRYGSPADKVPQLEEGGASCLSVLTDRAWFHAHPHDLEQARQACRLPVLRKDFLIEPVQVWQARAMGADCVLLVMRLLEVSQAQELETLALTLGMDVLVEVHNDEELETALGNLQAAMIGVNARDLQSLAIDLPRAAALVSRVPEDRLAVAESGLRKPDDLLPFLEARSAPLAFLIGEAIMRSDDPTRCVAAFVEAATRA